MGGFKCIQADSCADSSAGGSCLSPCLSHLGFPPLQSPEKAGRRDPAYGDVDYQPRATWTYALSQQPGRLASWLITYWAVRWAGLNLAPLGPLASMPLSWATRRMLRALVAPTRANAANAAAVCLRLPAALAESGFTCRTPSLALPFRFTPQGKEEEGLLREHQSPAVPHAQGRDGDESDAGGVGGDGADGAVVGGGQRSNEQLRKRGPAPTQPYDPERDGDLRSIDLRA